MSDEFLVTVVVKFIEVASWHKRAWDFGRENIIIISFHKKYHFFSLLSINYYFLHCLGLPCFNSNVAVTEVENVFTQCRKFMMNQSSTSYILFIHFYSGQIKNNVGGLSLQFKELGSHGDVLLA